MNLQVKPGSRILALATSPFSHSSKSAKVFGVIGRQGIIEGMLSFNVAVDGSDSTYCISRSLLRSRFAEQVKVIAVNGNTLAGMNLIDTDELQNTTNSNFISITRKKPRFSELENALKKAKLLTQKRHELLEFATKNMQISKVNGYYLCAMKKSSKTMTKFVTDAVVLLRIAHMAASASAKGESTGRI